MKMLRSSTGRQRRGRSLPRAVTHHAGPADDPAEVTARAADVLGVAAPPGMPLEAAVARFVSGQLELAELGGLCSSAEQRAESAERMAVLWKTVQYLEGRGGEVFEGTVSGVTDFGLFVQLDELDTIFSVSLVVKF